jgi:lipid-A-disaccharide synthase
LTAEVRGRRALIVTGEASGDLHGANLIRAAREIDPELHFFGVGGQRMADAGCDIRIRGEEIAVMGLVEVLGHLPVIWRAFRKLKAILNGPERPDLLICIDFPDFNLRLAAVAKRAGIPVLHYVSPQVWAWRRGRVKSIARVVDRLACILPFEPPLYQGLDIDAEYVGNPLADEAVVEVEREEFLTAHGIDPARPVVGLFPGSRHNELRHSFATLLGAAAIIHKRHPRAQFLLPVAPSLNESDFSPALETCGVPIRLSRDNIYDLAHACDAVLAVSGTVTLQTALVGTPMAIFYRTSPLTYAIGKRLVKVEHFGLANIVAGRKVAREFLQEEATPEALAGEILRILDDSVYAQTIRRGLEQVRERIGPSGCSRRVAAMASEMSRGIVRKMVSS